MDLAAKRNSTFLAPVATETSFISTQQLEKMLEKGVNSDGGEIIPLDCTWGENKGEVELKFQWKHL